MPRHMSACITTCTTSTLAQSAQQPVQHHFPLNVVNSVTQFLYSQLLYFKVFATDKIVSARMHKFHRRH